MRFDPQANHALGGGRTGSFSRRPSAEKARLRRSTLLAAVGMSAVLGAWIWKEMGGPLPPPLSIPRDEAPRAPSPAAAATQGEAPDHGPDGAGPATRRTASAARPRHDPPAGADEHAPDEAEPPADIELERSLRTAKALMARRRYQVAIAPLAHAVRVAPRNAEAHYRLGLCYTQVGRIAAAEEERDILLELDRNLASLLNTLIRSESSSSSSSSSSGR